MEIQKGKIYKHFKNGYVLVYSIEKGAEGGTRVSYIGLNDGIEYNRSGDEFFDEKINSEGAVVPRFTLATDEESEKFLSKEDLVFVSNFLDSIRKKIKTNNFEKKN